MKFLRVFITVKIVIEEEERMLNYRQQKDTSPSQPVVTDILGTFHIHWTRTVGGCGGSADTVNISVFVTACSVAQQFGCLASSI